MMQNQLLTLDSVDSIGEEISHELGGEMIKSYVVANSQDVHYYVIGRNIIDKILAQPHCKGIKLFNAYNELGEKTLVYVGVDEKGTTLIQYNCINNEGLLETQKGIVADRITRGGGYEIDIDTSWSWEID